MVGEHPDDPMSIAAPAGSSFLAAAERATPPRRVAWGSGLGLTPIHSEVRAICEKAARSFETLGATVVEAHPDLSGAKKAFFTLRNRERVLTQAKLVEEHEAALTPTLVHYVRHGMTLTAKEIGEAESVRGAIYRNVVAFFKEYDLLITPAVVAPPFPADMLHLMEMEGHRFEDYFEYL